MITTLIAERSGKRSRRKSMEQPFGGERIGFLQRGSEWRL